MRDSGVQVGYCLRRLAVAVAFAGACMPGIVHAYRHSGVPEPTPSDLAAIKKEWLAGRVPCNLPTRLKWKQLYQPCLRVLLSTMPPLDPEKREHFGEHYDPAKYFKCRSARKQNDSSWNCMRHALRRVESPEHWPYHDKPPIKWPEAPKESVYREGMGPIEYWRALCKAEAGEFVVKTVENVEGFFLIRPRVIEIERAFGERYVMEDPYGYIFSEAGVLSGIPGIVVGPPSTSQRSTKHYEYLETTPLQIDRPKLSLEKHWHPSVSRPMPNGRPYQRYYYQPADSFKYIRMEYIADLRSNYGVTWRGIRRPLDREIGVAGGELAIVDLKSGAIVAIRRGFVLGSAASGGRVNWFNGNVCPQYSRMPGIGGFRRRSKDVDFSMWFINKVLIPSSTAQN